MVLAVDVGGTNIKLGVVDEKFNILKKFSIPTPKETGDSEAIRAIAQMAMEIHNEYPFEKIGIGFPGTIDCENGICVAASNLDLYDVDVTKLIKEITGFDAFIENDANCATLGELYAGCGTKYSDFLFVTLGTGIGGGIVINNKMYIGSSGGAGEFGEMVIIKDGLQCNCGNRGCWEQYGSVTALIRQTTEAVRKNPDSILAKLAKNGINGKTAFDAKEAGCSVAASVIDAYAEYLAVGLTNLVRIFDPQAIILGGAITNQGDNLLLPLKEKMFLEVELEISKLKNDAGLVGAAALAIRA